MSKNVATVGRRVYYMPPVNEMAQMPATWGFNEATVWDAGILHVRPMTDGRTSISAMVTAPNGAFYYKENVILADSIETAYPGDCYWMPYQVEKSKKDEAGSV